jgi:hypothetical protein
MLADTKCSLKRKVATRLMDGKKRYDVSHHETDQFTPILSLRCRGALRGRFVSSFSLARIYGILHAVSASVFLDPGRTRARPWKQVLLCLAAK